MMLILKELQTEQIELFETIRKEYHRGIVTFLAQDKFLKSEDREDLAQEVLIKIYRNIHRLDREKNPGPWIYTICRRSAIDFARGKEKKIRLCDFDEQTSPPSSYTGPEDQLMENEEMARLHSIMSDLPTRSRRLLYLIYWEGMTCRETAAALGMATGTVKYELHRLRKKIGRRWNER